MSRFTQTQVETMATLAKQPDRQGSYSVFKRDATQTVASLAARGLVSIRISLTLHGLRELNSHEDKRILRNQRRARAAKRAGEHG